MSVTFWFTAALALSWLSYRFLRMRMLNNIEPNRRRLLDSLGDFNFDVDPLFLGFFHPYCNAGGGGERVLWTAIRDIQREFPHAICVVYTGDTLVSKEQMLFKAKKNFNIELNPRSLAIVYLHTRYLVEDSRYPRFTLILQSLASMIMGYEAISQFVPDLFFDTMGYAFTYPLVHYLAQVKIAAYVHYPTISSDMLQRVHEQRSQYNNDAKLAKSKIWTTGKLVYYHIFAHIYGWCGSFADIVTVNSTWTKGHINQLWHADAEIVYPPCDTDRLNELGLGHRKQKIVSVAQFRPEKDHSMQLKAIAKLLEKYPQWRDVPGFELVLIGSSRNEGDEQRISRLKQEAADLGITDSVRFQVNASFEQLVTELETAKVGLHTMWNEHFGIGVVEYMAAGLIPVAHRSGGPKMDIVTDYDGKPTGYLADTIDGFAESLHEALSLSETEYERMASNARASASDKFSEVAFSRELMRSLRTCLT